MCNRAVQEAVTAADAPLRQLGVPAAESAVLAAVEGPRLDAHLLCQAPGRRSHLRPEEAVEAHGPDLCRKVVETAGALVPLDDRAAPEIARQEISAHAPVPTGVPAALAIALPLVLEISLTGPAVVATDRESVTVPASAIDQE